MWKAILLAALATVVVAQTPPDPYECFSAMIKLCPKLTGSACDDCLKKNDAALRNATCELHEMEWYCSGKLEKCYDSCSASQENVGMCMQCMFFHERNLRTECIPEAEEAYCTMDIFQCWDALRKDCGPSEGKPDCGQCVDKNREDLRKHHCSEREEEMFCRTPPPQ